MIMFVICLMRELDTIVDEFHDWQAEGLHVHFSGPTSKAGEGCIVIEWMKPLPDRFQHKLLCDDDILDFVLFGHPLPALPTQA